MESWPHRSAGKCAENYTEMRAQGVQSSNENCLGGVVSFEQSSQHFSSENYVTNLEEKIKILLSPCAV